MAHAAHAWRKSGYERFLTLAGFGSRSRDRDPPCISVTISPFQRPWLRFLPLR